jgi:hypothetical protein
LPPSVSLQPMLADLNADGNLDLLLLSSGHHEAGIY